MNEDVILKFILPLLNYGLSIFLVVYYVIKIGPVFTRFCQIMDRNEQLLKELIDLEQDKGNHSWQPEKHPKAH